MAEQNKNSQKLAVEAAEWIVLLSADDDTAKTRVQNEFDAWKNISPERQKIAQDIEQYLLSIQQLVQTPQQLSVTKSALKAGLHTMQKQKNIRYGGVFAVIFCTVSGFYSYLNYYPIRYLTADLKSKAGEWQVQTLEDGSQLKLRGKSAVNLKFTANQRVVELVQGEIFVDVAKDKARPFIVKTEHGEIEALGTAFSVDYDSTVTELKMLHSKVKVQSSYQTKVPSTVNQTIVKEGQEVTLDKNGIHPMRGFNVYSEQQKWHQQNLIVENMSLSKVLTELNKNSKEKIIFNTESLEKIKVNAVLPLDDTGNALQLLSSVFPQLKVYLITPYFTVVTLK